MGPMGPMGIPDIDSSLPWTRSTYDAKRHPDPMRRFSTMHWTDRQTDRPRKSLTTIGRFATRTTRPNNVERGAVFLRQKKNN